jgi:hypothetical protein
MPLPDVVPLTFHAPTRPPVRGFVCLCPVCDLGVCEGERGSRAWSDRVPVR